MLEDLAGKVVLIFGASTGIGAAVARGFSAQRARVAIHYNTSGAAAKELAADLGAAGSDVRLFQGDVTSRGTVERVIDQVVEAFGRLDVLINNVGAIVGRIDAAEIDDAFYDQVVDVNVRPVVMACRAAILPLRRHGGGVIINTSSIAARNGGGPGAAVYVSAKAFIEGLTRNLAKELAGQHIRVNAVAPGVVATPFHVHTSPEVMESFRRAIPMGRIGTPQDCVGAYLYLASDAMSGFVTGQVIQVNGGHFMA